jgi:type IV pilus assembly protein PilB
MTTTPIRKTHVAPLGDIVALKRRLLDDKLLTADQIASVERDAHDNNLPLSTALVRTGQISVEQITQILATVVGLPYVNIRHYTIERDVLNLIPERFARQFQVMPLFRIEDILTVALADPRNSIAISTMDSLLRLHIQVELVLSSEEGITRAIDEWYSLGEGRKALIAELADEVVQALPVESSEYQGTVGGIRLARAAEEAPIVRIVNSYIAQAMLEGASDVHWETKQEHMLVRFRIDGCLYNRGQVPRELAAPIVSRIKILSGLNIAQRRVPQDGRVSIAIRNGRIDIRTSTIPSLYGENVVLRILDKRRGIPELVQLGLSTEDVATLRGVLTLTSGMVLAAGPTGSGKTTTMFAAIAGMNADEQNIMTIEDPIEYEIAGIVQSQVDVKAGATFATTLRAMLRQDPDVIYVGEIRDLETAEIAVRAALTGHLVLSTVHTKDAVGTIRRLRDIGVGPAVIGDVVRCAFSQRLVRRICAECGGAGCNACSDSGYRGRIGLYEIMLVDQDVKRLIAEDAPEETLTSAARKAGMRSLREDGARKVADGITTMEEVQRMLTIDKVLTEPC